MYDKKVRLRRNPQECVLCHENETRDWDHICGDCRRAWQKGCDWLRVSAEPSGGLAEAQISWHWHLYHFDGDGQGGGERADQPSVDVLADGISAGLGGRRWLPEPRIGRVVPRVPDRVNKLKALGNAVVPQVAEWIGRGILEADEARYGR